MTDLLPIATVPLSEDVLVYGPRLGFLVAMLEDEPESEWPWYTLDGPQYRRAAFTHWMPLPSPPIE